MANNVYGAISLIGGGAGALDAIAGTGLQDKDFAIVSVQGDNFYAYVLDATSGAAESSPDIIKPDVDAGTKRWIFLEGTAAAFAAAAAASAVEAGLSESGAEAVLDEFTDLYLGDKSSDPTLDNDGDALQDGALYWNNSTKLMRVYDLGTTSWSTAVGVGTNAETVDGVHTMRVEIGEWNMDTTISLTPTLASLGLAADKIISARATIKRDSIPSEQYDFMYHSSTIGSSDQGIKWDATYLYLLRATGGFFDSPIFQNTSGYNRGWIIIEYVD